MNGNPKENEESLLLNIQEQTNSFEDIKKIEEDSTAT
jgi:hypothetical protein